MIPWNQQRPSIPTAFSGTALQAALEWFGEKTGGVCHHCQRRSLLVGVDTSKYLLIVNPRYHMFMLRELWGEQNYLWCDCMAADTWVLVGEKGVYWSEMP